MRDDPARFTPRIVLDVHRIPSLLGRNWIDPKSSRRAAKRRVVRDDQKR